MYPRPVDRSSTLVSTVSLKRPQSRQMSGDNDNDESKDDFYRFVNIDSQSPNHSLPSPPPPLYRISSSGSSAPIINDHNHNDDLQSLASVTYNTPNNLPGQHHHHHHHHHHHNKTSSTSSSLSSSPSVTASATNDNINTNHNNNHNNNNNNNAVRESDIRYRNASCLFLATSVLSAILILIFESYMYAVINIHKKKMNSEVRYAEISIYLSLFIFAAVYQILLTTIGLKTKNMLLLAMLCLFYACMLIYTGIQFEEISATISDSLSANWRAPTRALNIATIAVLAVTLVTQAYMIFGVLRKNVKWFRYKKIGGDLSIKRMYTVFQIHRALLIFDFFFFLGFTVQFVVIMISNKRSLEFILTVCVLPLTVLILFASDFAATREIKSLTCTTIFVFLLSCAYVVFKIVRLFTKYSSAYNVGVTPGAYFPGRKSLLTFGVITILLLLCTVSVECILFRNYNCGLYPLVSTYYSWLPYHTDNRALINAYWKKHNDISMTSMSEKAGAATATTTATAPATPAAAVAATPGAVVGSTTAAPPRMPAPSIQRPPVSARNSTVASFRTRRKSMAGDGYYYENNGAQYKQQHPQHPQQSQNPQQYSHNHHQSQHDMYNHDKVESDDESLIID